MIERLKNEIEDIERQLEQGRQDSKWRKKARYALHKKREKLKAVQKGLRVRAHNIRPSDLVFQMYHQMERDSEVKELAKIFLVEKCGYEVR